MRLRYRLPLAAGLTIALLFVGHGAEAVYVPNSLDLQTTVSLKNRTRPGSPPSKSDYEVVYRLFLPPDYDPNRKYPLVLFQHGTGAIGNDNVSQLRSTFNLINALQSEQFAAFLLAPQTPPDLPSAQANIGVLDQVLEAYPNIDQRRLYVTGHSMGGAATWAELIDRPYMFAAAVPLAAPNWFDLTGMVDVFAQVPIYAFHGDNDTTVPLSHTQDMIDALIAAGGAPLFEILPGRDHLIREEVYEKQYLYEWLFEQELPLGDMDGNRVVDTQDSYNFERMLVDKGAFIPSDPDFGKQVLILENPWVNPDAVGDLDGNGMFDAFDVDDFEAMLASGGPAVPEPATFTLLGLGGLMMLRRRVGH